MSRKAPSFSRKTIEEFLDDLAAVMLEFEKETGESYARSTSSSSS